MTLSDVLRNGRPYDPEGQEVVMSRQACENAADLLDLGRCKSVEWKLLDDTLQQIKHANALLIRFEANSTFRSYANSQDAPALVQDVHHYIASHGLQERPRCQGCGNEIDPDCCGCGDSKEGHDSMWMGHSFVPMGCDCFREPSQSEKNVP